MRKPLNLKNAPQTTAVTKFWNMASIDDDSAEITLYGDVCSQQPYDWWTGEPLKGDYITPEGFREDLEAIAGKKNITIKINSCGGDLYTGIAIHNAIKALDATKTVVIEGIAASAASVIACAGDEVHVYPGSMIMIHGVSALICDYMNLQDLKKMSKSFEAAEKAIANIYNAKTGLEVDHLRNLMTKETWFVGEDAVKNSFADKVIEDEGPKALLSADKKLMLVAGIKHNIGAFKNIPSVIPVDASVAPIEDKIIENKEEAIDMTLEELKAQCPELVAEIEASATASIRDEAIASERARLQEIESIEATIGDAELIAAAKYGEKPMTAAELAFVAVKKQAALGNSFLASRTEELDNAGVNTVGAAANGGEPNSEISDDEMINQIVELYNSTK